MTSVDTNVDLIINQLTEEQYFQLSVQGKIDDNQLYLVPDNREYYEKSQTSSNVELTRKFDELSLDITNKVYFDDISSSGYNNLSIIKIPNEEYRKLVADGKCLSNVLYIISSEFEDFYGRVLSNVTMTEDDVESEVATKHYVDEVISEVDLSIAQNATNIDNNARNITTLTTKYTDSQLSIANISSRLSQCVKSDYLEANYYNKTQTSSSTEITDRFDKHIKVGTYQESSGYTLNSSDLSVIKISEDDYLKLVADGRQNDKVLYIVSSDILNMRNERIINVAEPSISSDAATKYYVDSSISSFTPQTYSAGYGLNLNNHQFSIDTSKVAEVNDLTAYETKADLTANYYKKNQTSSNVELNNKFNTLSTYSQIKNQLSNDHYLTAHQSLDNYYTKNQTSSTTEISTSFANYNSQLTGYSKTIEYNSTAKKIYLKNGSKTLGTVDCTDFIKDGMLSSAELCGSVLVFKFNTDAGTTPISVNLSSFANVYSAGYGLNLINGQFSVDTSKMAEITDLTAYETKSDLTANYYTKNQTSSNVELNNKFNNIYTKSETSSAIELRNRFDNIIKVGSYLNSTGYSLSSSNLSVIKMSEEDYLKLIADERQDDRILYVVSSDNLNMRNERVVNVAEPIADDDAATKQYVDSSISSMETLTIGHTTINETQLQQLLALLNASNNVLNQNY